MTSYLFYNARIICSSKRGDEASWMLVGDHVIKQLGKGQPPRAYFRVERDNECVDMNGQVIIPGLIDAHLHVMHLGEQLSDVVQLGACRSISDLQAALEAFQRTKASTSSSSSSSAWVRGFGWQQDALGRYPCAADIDVVYPDTPVVLWRVCMHVCVVNTAALRLLGIHQHQSSIPGGVVDIHPHTNQPTGVLREAATIRVSELQRASITDDMRLDYLRTALRHCVAHGITAVQTNDEASWHLYRRLEHGGELPIRVQLTILASEIRDNDADNDADNNDHEIPKQWQRCGELLSCNRAKIFADGAFGPSTAALSHAYMPHKHEYGVLIHDNDRLRAIVQRAHNAGYRLEIHVIGDRACEQVLDALKECGVGANDRPILTHCQFLRDDLIARMREQGCIASVQPSFLPTDVPAVLAKCPPLLQPYAYAWKTLLNRGVHVCGGSDAPIEAANPLLGMYDAMFRKPTVERNDNDQPWHANECLSLHDALHIYTDGAAYASMSESMSGKLQCGYNADFVVLDAQVWNNPSLLKTSAPLQVWVSGTRRH